jgi:ribonuclease HII
VFDVSVPSSASGGRFAGVDEAGRGPLAGPVVAAAVILNPARPIEGLRDSKRLSTRQRDARSLEIRARSLAWAIGEASAKEIDRMNILVASMLAMRRAVRQLRLQFSAVEVDGPHNPGLFIARRPEYASQSLHHLGVPGKAEAEAEVDAEAEAEAEAKTYSKAKAEADTDAQADAEAALDRALWDTLSVRCIVRGDQHVAEIAAASILAKTFRDRWMTEAALRFPGYGFEHHKGYPTPEHRSLLSRLGLSPIHRRSFAWK